MTRQQEREFKRTGDRLLKTEALELLAILAVHFNVPMPNLAWSIDGVRGHAKLEQWTIFAGARSWIGTTNLLLHEFAHLLNFKRNGYGRTRSGARRPHGPLFIETLYEVAEAWHGDAAKYGWGLEYKTVAAAGPKAK